MKRYLQITWIVVCLAAIFTGIPAAAQSRSLRWERWDVVIDEIDTKANTYRVTETQEIRFTSGTFRFGQRDIGRQGIEAIEDVQVWQGETPLDRTSGGESPGTYYTFNNNGKLSIRMYFLAPVQSPETVLLRISYTVVGAIRYYEGGDQIYWEAIPPNVGFPVQNATAMIEMPDSIQLEQERDIASAYGTRANVYVEDNTVYYEATETITENPLEIRVQFPHDPEGRVAPWQQSYDQQRAFEENVQPLISLGTLILGLLFMIGGPVLAYMVWYTKGRDPSIGVVPEYLSEPPSDLPPAVAGTLIDEQADTRDVIATIIDLAQRGYLIMEEDKEEKFLGLFDETAYAFRRTEKPASDLRPFERKMLTSIFGSSDYKEMSDLRNKFYRHISSIKDQLYDEIVSEGFFSRSPNTTRGLWAGLGFFIMFLSFGAFFVASRVFVQIGAGGFFAAFGLIVAGIAFTVIGNYMPAKTRKGAEEAAKWDAFRKYMQTIDKRRDLEEAGDLFEQYLGYAVAFGIDRSWTNKFAAVPTTPVPVWYYPVWRPGWGGYSRRWGRGPVPMSDIGRGAGGIPDVDFARPEGPGGLQGMSDGFAGSLNDISDGLSSMLNQASSALTSRPQSKSTGSWGGGGGWSGGGSSGGGSSGGGGGMSFG